MTEAALAKIKNHNEEIAGLADLAIELSFAKAARLVGANYKLPMHVAMRRPKRANSSLLLMWIHREWGRQTADRPSSDAAFYH